MTIRETIEDMERETLESLCHLERKFQGGVTERNRSVTFVRSFNETATVSYIASRFRRLKNKTQVFLTPKGRPLPHAYVAYA